MINTSKEMKNKNSKGKTISEKEQSKITRKISDLDKKIKEKISELKKTTEGVSCYPLLGNIAILPNLVDDVFSELRKTFKDCNGKLNVILDSPGGDIDAAYNLALLFRKFATKKLNFIIPRWAKSAATLLVCGGDEIIMTPVAELGPIDPQITEFNPLEKRLERFSPLHIESTLDLIRDEFTKGNEELAKGLIERLQFPLTLGSFKKSLDIGKDYLVRLLSSRMITGSDAIKKATEIAEKLTTGYSDHRFCIEIKEAESIGLSVKELNGKQLDIIWEIHILNRKKDALITKQRESRMKDLLKNLPPDIFNKLPPDVLETIGK